jgi:hypothetical protein
MGWTKLQIEELYDLYSSPKMICVIRSRIMRLALHVAHRVERKESGKHERKRQLERPRRKWENNIRMDLKSVCWEGVHCFDLAQDRENW